MLGLTLFERDRRRVLPTPAGAAMITLMRRLLVDADALLDASRRAGDPFTGTLRIGVIPTISPYLLPRLTPAFRHRFPKLTTIWTEEKTPVLMARLAAGTLDAAVLALEAELGEVEHEVVARDPFVLATPTGHALAHGRKPVRESELAGESVLLLDEGHCFRTQALAFCSRAEAHEMAFRATSLGTLAQMVAGRRWRHPAAEAGRAHGGPPGGAGPAGTRRAGPVPDHRPGVAAPVPARRGAPPTRARNARRGDRGRRGGLTPLGGQTSMSLNKSEEW
jgi:DNA-binding transcriptional LysR family regulator